MSRTPALGGAVFGIRRLWRPATATRTRSPLLGPRLAPSRLFHWDPETDEAATDAQDFRWDPETDPPPTIDNGLRTEFPAYRHVHGQLNPRPRRVASPDITCPEISDIIIDLDALSAPGVRLFDDYDQKAEDARWEQTMDNAVGRETMSAYADELNKAQEDFEEVSSNRDKAHWRIRDYDILSAALRGAHLPLSEDVPGPHKRSPMTKAERKFDLPRVLRINGIHPLFWEDTPLLLKWMLARCKTPDESSFVGPPLPLPGNDEAPSLKWPECRRLVSLALTTKRGITDDGKEGSQQKLLLEDLARAETAQGACDRLLYLGAHRQAASLSKRQLDYHLCAAGMQCSIDACLLGYAAEYLVLLVEHPDVTPDFVKKSLGEALRRVEAVIDRKLGLKNDNNPAIAASVDRLQLFRFLGPFRKAITRPEPDDVYYATYIRILGKLGALRTIWYEWHETTTRACKWEERRTWALADMFAEGLMGGRRAVLQYDLKTEQKVATSKARLSRKKRKRRARVVGTEAVELAAAVLEATTLTAQDCAGLPANIEPLPSDENHRVPSGFPRLLLRAIGVQPVEAALPLIKRLIEHISRRPPDKGKDHGHSSSGYARG